MERCVSIEVVVILQDGTTPVKYGLTMDMEDKCSAIPPRLARVCGVPPQHLVLVDIFQAQVRGWRTAIINFYNLNKNLK